MPSIKKSELEDLRLKANSADCYRELWEARNVTVSKFLHNGINLAAKLQATEIAAEKEYDEFKYALAARDSQIANLYKRERALRRERLDLLTDNLTLRSKIDLLSEPRGFWAKLFGKLLKPPTEAKPESNRSFETDPQV